METFFGGSSGQVLADRRYDMAIRLGQEGDFAAAADMIAQALEIAPSWAPLYFHLGDMQTRAGQLTEAIAAYQGYLGLDPADRMGAIVKLAIMKAAPLPEQLPAAYIQSLFDQYAPRFDTSLVKTLEYEVPAKMATAVRDVRPAPYARLLDLGCGTGLAAAEFSGEAAYIEGVDLSPEMIEEARRKNIYAHLHVADIVEFLKRPHTPFDLVLCADVFIYMGALDETFRLSSSVLAPNGIFSFSVQAADADGDWILRHDHRYGHSKSYLASCIEKAGMEIAFMQDTVIRKDGGKPVDGIIFVCRKL